MKISNESKSHAIQLRVFQSTWRVHVFVIVKVGVFHIQNCKTVYLHMVVTAYVWGAGNNSSVKPRRKWTSPDFFTFFLWEVIFNENQITAEIRKVHPFNISSINHHGKYFTDQFYKNVVYLVLIIQIGIIFRLFLLIFGKCFEGSVEYAWWTFFGF